MDREAGTHLQAVWGEVFGAHDPFETQGRTFAVCQQLGDKTKSDIDQIKTALVRAFAPDFYMVYKQLIEWHLWYDESELKKFLFLLGRMSDRILACTGCQAM